MTEGRRQRGGRERERERERKRRRERKRKRRREREREREREGEREGKKERERERENERERERASDRKERVSKEEGEERSFRVIRGPSLDSSILEQFTASKGTCGVLYPQVFVPAQVKLVILAKFSAREKVQERRRGRSRRIS